MTKRNHRLHPSPGHPSYHLLRSLAAQLRREIEIHAPRGAVLDVGCGSRPYQPLFQNHAESYIGLDWKLGPGVDVVASADALPFEDASFDVVLCSQVLEHVRRPATTVSELARVLRPGGLALLSTHGVIRYHPNPGDYWRWTHEGLAMLFAENGPWHRVEVSPNGRTPVAIGYLIMYEASILARRGGLKRPWRTVTTLGNVLVRQAERFSGWAQPPGATPALAPNYLVSATR